MLLTLLSDGERTGDADVADGRVLVSAAVVRDLTGWELKDVGLCQGDVCVPTRSRPDLVDEGRVDLAVFADLLRRPLAVSVSAEGAVAVLGESSAAVAESMASLAAPEFTLPDLAGNMVSLSDFRGRKVVVHAWASW